MLIVFYETLNLTRQKVNDWLIRAIRRTGLIRKENVVESGGVERNRKGREKVNGWMERFKGRASNERKGLARGRRSHLRARKRFPLSMKV